MKIILTGKSSGARTEIEWADTNNKKIFYPKPISDLDEIVAWAKK
jgi:hypothetical protein